MKKAFLAVVLAFLFFGVSAPQKTLAQLACTFESKPSSGNQTTNFNIIISLCYPNSITPAVDPFTDPRPVGYRIVVNGTKGGNSTTFCVTANTILQGATLRIPGSGITQSDTYTAELQWIGFNPVCDPSINQAGQFLTNTTFSVTVDSQAKLPCGTVISVLPSDSDPCDPKCPLTRQTDPYGGPATGWFCKCGIVNSPCCPKENSGGFPVCANSAMECTSSGICQSINTKLTRFEGACAGGTGIDTAIGCIPIDTFEKLAIFFISWGLGIGGGIAFFALIAGSFMVISSGGDLEKLKQGKEIVFSAISGVIVLAFAVFLFRLIGVNVLGLF